MQQVEQSEVAIIPVAQLATKTTATLKQFNCGDKFLDDFAKTKLVKNNKKDLIKGFVAICDDRVVGYVTTKVASLDRDNVSEKGLPKALPVLSLEQIATDLDYRGRLIGKRLLQIALKVTAKVSDETGVYGLQLWSHPNAVGFYEKHSFTPLQIKNVGDVELTLMFLHIETIRKALGA